MEFFLLPPLTVITFVNAIALGYAVGALSRASFFGWPPPDSVTLPMDLSLQSNPAKLTLTFLLRLFFLCN